MTGGCSGIGLATVQRFVAAGATVIAADLRTTAEFDQLGVEFLQLDVAVENQVAKVFYEAREKLGLLDILVNNAGIGLHEEPISETNIDTFDKVLSVNLKGVLFGLKYGPRYMNDGGSIINTASLAATITMPEYTAYSISKAGVIKLTQQAAVELSSRRIRVNAVCPGTVVTPMEPADGDEAVICSFTTVLGRPGTAEEQAAVFHFLAADDSRYVNAQAIHVDGGWVHGVTYALTEKLVG